MAPMTLSSQSVLGKRSFKHPWWRRHQILSSGWSNVNCELNIFAANFNTSFCRRGIPSKGNTAEIVLTVLHRNFLGVDEFLGRVPLPLSSFDHHEKARSKWYPLQCKPGQSKTDYRGELEVRIEFKVNSRY